MAFIAVTTFVQCNPLSRRTTSCTPTWPRHTTTPCIAATLGGNGKKPSRSRKFRPGSGAPAQKTKLEPETVFIETGPSTFDMIIPTLSILTVVGIIPFIAALTRAAWVRYKITSRRIAVSSGFQGKDQTEIIYRDVEQVKYVRRLGGAADCVFTLKDGAKLELRSLPDFTNVYQYILERLDEKAREASGPA